MNPYPYFSYKESGVEWIGEIPDDWTTNKIKYLTDGKKDSFIDGDWIESTNISESGIRYITTGNIGEGVYKEQGKGYISEDSGVTFTEGVLVDEGTWGTNKKIIAFHDLDISAQTGSAMCYKITTHNQSASKVTNVHATSIGWR